MASGNDQHGKDQRGGAAPEGAELQAGLQRLAGLADQPLDLATLMQHAVDAALDLFPVSGTGLMFVDEGQVLRYVASSDALGEALEGVQETAGIGPCVDCVVLDRVVSTRDVQGDPRWSALRAEVAGSPVRAVLGVPVRLGGAAVGALDAYLDAEHDWTEAEITALRAYAGVIENLLAVRLAQHRSDALVEQLQHALDYRVVIERGVGYLMARDDTDAVTAFNILRSAARRSRRRAVDVAADLLAGEPLP